MSNRKDAKREQAKRASWYKLKPIAWVFPALLFIGLWIPPLARGDALGWATLERALWGTGIAVLVGLLIAWLAWRCCFKSTGTANVVFCTAVIGCGIWSIALSDHQRADAQNEVTSAIDEQVGNVKRQVQAVID